MINLKLAYTVTDADNSKSVKYILKNKLSLSERLVKKLKYAGQILSNSSPVHINSPVYTGDVIEANIEFDDINEEIHPEKMDLDILFEDDCIIALNKPPYMVVHPTSYHLAGTIANGVMHYLLDKSIRTRIRPVSRLDRNTSGIIIFALNQYVQEMLIRQMHQNTYYKEYVGIVHGNFENESGVIDLPIERKPDSIMLRHISQSGAPSVTRYEVLEHLNNSDFVKFILETGRTHQIRVHCQATGHPLVGDTLYPHLGRKDLYLNQKYDASLTHKIPKSMDSSEELSRLIFEKSEFAPIVRQALHSRKTVFVHPVYGNTLTLVAPIPPDICRALEILKK